MIMVVSGFRGRGGVASCCSIEQRGCGKWGVGMVTMLSMAMMTRPNARIE